MGPPSQAGIKADTRELMALLDQARETVTSLARTWRSGQVNPSQVS